MADRHTGAGTKEVYFGMLRETNQGTILPVKIIPKAQQSKIVGWENGELKIRIAALPEKGEANRELIRFLAKELDIPQRDVIILRGETSRKKEILLPIEAAKKGLP